MAVFLYSKWLATPITTRQKVAAQFNIPKVRSTHVMDNHVQDDGYDIKDIETALNVDALQNFLETSETDMEILMNEMVDKLLGQGKYAPEAVVVLDGPLGTIEVTAVREPMFGQLPQEEVERSQKEYDERQQALKVKKVKKTKKQ